MLNVPNVPNVLNSIWRPPIGDSSFDGSPAVQQTAPPPAQGVVVANAGNDVTVRQSLTGMRQGQVTAFSDNRYTGGNAVTACCCDRLLYRAHPFVRPTANVPVAGTRTVGVAGPSRDRVDEFARRHIPASIPASTVFREAPAPAFQPTFFDVVVKKLENRINCSPLARPFPWRRLIVLGMAGSRPAEGHMPDSIELIYSRCAQDRAVALTIAVTDLHGFRSVSPACIFEKPTTAIGELSLIERILFEGAVLALAWLTDSKENNYEKSVRTGMAEAYKWREQIGKTFNPPMEPWELGARIASFCTVATMGPRLLAPGSDGNVADGFKERLLTRLTRYLATKLKGDWHDVRLIVTGLNRMNAKPPGDNIEMYLHIWYTLLEDGNVDLLTTKKNGRAMESSRHLFRKSEYYSRKTFDGQLLFFGIFAATADANKLPDQKAVASFRGRIGDSLVPPIKGDPLGRAMWAYFPLPAQTFGPEAPAS